MARPTTLKTSGFSNQQAADQLRTLLDTTDGDPWVVRPIERQFLRGLVTLLEIDAHTLANLLEIEVPRA